MERETGIEPARTAWEAATLPLSYSRSAGRVYRKTQAILYALPRSVQLTVARLPHGIELFIWSVRLELRGKEFRRHKLCDVRNLRPIDPLMDAASAYLQRQSLFFCHSLLPMHLLPLFDDVSNRLWMRHIYGVTAFNLHDRCTGALHINRCAWAEASYPRSLAGTR